MITRVVPASFRPRSSSISSPPVLAVEVAGRLVGEDDRRLADQRPRHRHPLALAAGELGGAVALAVGEADPGQRRGGAAAALAGRHAGVEQPVGDVVDHRRRLEQEELLEDEADPGRAQAGQLVVAGARRGRGPRSRSLPLLGRSSVPIRCSRVDLPEPEGPTIAVSSPRSTLSETPRSASTPPG